MSESEGRKLRHGPMRRSGQCVTHTKTTSVHHARQGDILDMIVGTMIALERSQKKKNIKERFESNNLRAFFSFCLLQNLQAPEREYHPRSKLATVLQVLAFTHVKAKIVMDLLFFCGGGRR